MCICACVYCLKSEATYLIVIAACATTIPAAAVSPLSRTTNTIPPMAALAVAARTATHAVNSATDPPSPSARLMPALLCIERAVPHRVTFLVAQKAASA